LSYAVSYLFIAIVWLPTSEADLELLEFVSRWPCRLADHGLQISTGPVVPC